MKLLKTQSETPGKNLAGRGRVSDLYQSFASLGGCGTIRVEFAAGSWIVRLPPRELDCDSCSSTWSCVQMNCATVITYKLPGVKEPQAKTTDLACAMRVNLIKLLEDLDCLFLGHSWPVIGNRQ